MRSDRNATLNFGMASIPVGVAKGVRREKVEFKTIHRECKEPVNQKWHCKKCKKDVTGEETMRGIEVSKDGPWIPVEDSEYEAAESDFSTGIMLTKFVARDRINELLYSDGYWLIPNDKDPEQRYWSLWNGMCNQEVVALGRQNLYKTEQVVAVCAVPGGLVMFNLHAPWEVVPPDWEPGQSSAMNNRMTETFINEFKDEPSDEDFERRDLTRKKALVESKVKGKKVKMPKKQELPAPGDFIEQLKVSIDKQRAQKAAAKERAGSRK